MYTRKQLREITGLPDKTLRWLIDKLDIQPADFARTVFGSPIYLYDEDALHELHAYIFHRKVLKDERSKGKRCRGGCNRYLPPVLLNSQQICDTCRRRSWIRNEIYSGDIINNQPDLRIAEELKGILEDFLS